MTKSKTEKIADCVSTFEHAVLMHDEFSLKDSDVANKSYDSSIKALKQLNKFGDEGLSALATLLDHEKRVVRVTAASYLISHYTSRAIKVLTEAAEAEHPSGGLAIVTLRRWQLGRYLDPASGKEIVLKGRENAKTLQ